MLFFIIIIIFIIPTQIGKGKHVYGKFFMIDR